MDAGGAGGSLMVGMAIRAPGGAKNGLILPTGQLYAPSAVINYAWYCMVLYCIAWYFMALHDIAW